MELFAPPETLFWAYSGVIPFLLQVTFLHPYYQQFPLLRLFRLAVIPYILYLTIIGVHKRRLEPAVHFLHLNFPLVAIPSFHVGCLSIIFGIHAGPVFKSEIEPPKRKESKTREGRNDGPNTGVRSQKPEGETDTPGSSSKQPFLPQSRAPSAGELTKFVASLIMSPRGLQCTWAPPEKIVPLLPKMPNHDFVKMTLIRTICQHLIFQSVCAFGVPSAQHPQGAYGFLTDELGFPTHKLLEWFAPYLFTLVLGLGAYSGFALVGCLFDLVELGFYSTARKFLTPGNQFRPDPFDPTIHPPLFISPWARTSLSEFWSQGWQAVFRLHFLICGALPMYHLLKPFGPTAGRMGGLMGAMILSAAMHEFCLVSVTKPDPTYSSTMMFLAQGGGIIAETVFRKVFKRRVNGFAGWLWTYSFLLFCGRRMVDAWLRNGLGSAGIRRIEQWEWHNYIIPFGPLIPEPEILRNWVSKIF